MTSEELDAIEDRANAATPEPWVRVGPSGQSITATFGNVCQMHDGGQTASRVEANARFICAAREDVPELIAHIRSLEAALLEIETQCDLCGHDVEVGQMVHVCAKAWADALGAPKRCHDELLATCDARDAAEAARAEATLKLIQLGDASVTRRAAREIESANAALAECRAENVQLREIIGHWMAQAEMQRRVRDEPLR